MTENTNTHISQKRKDRTRKQLKLRIKLFQKLIKYKIIHKKTEKLTSDKNIIEYSSGIIEPLSLNAAKDQKKLWGDIQLYKNDYKVFLKNLKNEDPKISDETSNDDIHANVSLLKKQNISLINQLHMLRGMYLDLLNKSEDESNLSKIHQEAIKRHREHYGMYAVNPESI
jgi:hypothetical protein